MTFYEFFNDDEVKKIIRDSVWPTVDSLASVDPQASQEDLYGTVEECVLDVLFMVLKSKKFIVE